MQVDSSYTLWATFPRGVVRIEVEAATKASAFAAAYAAYPGALAMSCRRNEPAPELGRRRDDNDPREGLVLPVEPDFELTGEGGTLWLLLPVSDAGREWLAQHIAENAQFWGLAVAVESRFIENLVAGIRLDGLVVRGSN
jgi:hypothetical protein